MTLWHYRNYDQLGLYGHSRRWWPSSALGQLSITAIAILAISAVLSFMGIFAIMGIMLIMEIMGILVVISVIGILPINFAILSIMVIIVMMAIMSIFWPSSELWAARWLWTLRKGHDGRYSPCPLWPWISPIMEIMWIMAIIHIIGVISWVMTILAWWPSSASRPLRHHWNYGHYSHLENSLHCGQERQLCPLWGFSPMLHVLVFMCEKNQ